MSTLILEKNKYIEPSFIVPNTQLVTIDFESSGPVDVYVVSPSELAVLKKQTGPPNVRKYTGILSVNEKIKFNLPFRAVWYLVIVNRSTTNDVSIFYRVFNSQP